MHGLSSHHRSHRHGNYSPILPAYFTVIVVLLLAKRLRCRLHRLPLLVRPTLGYIYCLPYSLFIISVDEILLPSNPPTTDKNWLVLPKTFALDSLLVNVWQTGPSCPQRATTPHWNFPPRRLSARGPVAYGLTMRYSTTDLITM